MAKVPLTDISSLNDVTALNNNFTAIENAFQENVLFRLNPTTDPNTMQNDLDMNSKRVYNLPTPIHNSEAARLQDVQNAISGATAANLISVTPVVNMPSTNVQAALESLTTQVYAAPAASTELKIAVMGESLSGQNGLLGNAWPAILERNLNALNIKCRVYNFALNAMDFYSANTQVRFGTNTPVQQLIALAPDIIISTMGLKDAVVSPTRSLAQVQADATTYYSTLDAALPSCKMVHMVQRPYNADYFTPATLVNKGVVPNWFKLKSAGILANTYCSEMLDDAVDAATITAFTNFNSLNSTISALGTVDKFGYIEYWKIARLGGVGNDNIHIKEAGSVLQAGYVQKALFAASFAATLFPKKSDQNTAYWNDPDQFFTDFLTATGSGNYTQNVSGLFAEPLTLQRGPYRDFSPENWYFPYHTQFTVSPLTATFDPISNGVYCSRGGPPNQTVYASLNGAAFVSNTTATDASGHAIILSPYYALQLAAGTHTLRYKVGNEVYGPYTLTLGANNMPYVHMKRTSAQTLPNNTYTAIAFDTIVVDRASEGSTGASSFTASRTGIYQFCASAFFDTISANSSGFISLYKNGIKWADGSVGVYSSTFLILGTEVNAILSLVVGDVITVRAYYTGTGSANIIQGADNSATRLQATYIRP
jgi:hypothetical protein